MLDTIIAYLQHVRAEHSTEFFVLASVLLPALANGLTEYPKTKGLGLMLKTVLDHLSFTTSKDAGKTFKMLGFKSPIPKE
jgi:hypothetical protein